MALRELIISTAAQFGQFELGLRVLGSVHADMSDREIVNVSYDYKIANYRALFASSTREWQEEVRRRFIEERDEILALIR